MAASRYRLTPQLIDELCNSLRAGAFEHVALELAGVPYRVYREWRSRGKCKKALKIYRELDQAVMEAKAHARFMAESHMRTKEPRLWLFHGPGKETPDRPGWSSMPRADVERDGDGISHEVMQLIAIVNDFLKPHPEMRMEFSKKLSGELKPRQTSAGERFTFDEGLP